MVAIVIAVLHNTAALFIPLVLAIVVWYILITIASFYQRIQIYGAHLPYGVALLFSILTCLFLFSLLVTLIRDNVAEFLIVLPVYQAKLQALLLQAESVPGLGRVDLSELWKHIDLPTVASAIVGGVNTLAGYIATTMLYTLFILLEYRNFGAKLDALFPNEERRQQVSEIIHSINTDAQTYIRIQTFISALTALCVYVTLLLFNVQFAAFWALLTFVLNFIPTIGSIIASVFPPLFALAQFESLPLMLVIAVLIVSIQFLIGNVLQPRLMGSSLNLSPLAILVGLAVWGAIWGIVGMFLCIPILVISNIIFARFHSTRWIAVLCSGNGKVPSYTSSSS